MYRTTDPYHQPQLSRRRILKGLGATLTLPFLPSLGWAEGGRDITQPPRRWATIMMSNGVWPADWWAKGSGKDMQLSKTLQPLADFREDMIVLNGLRVYDSGKGFHVTGFTNWLNGAQVTKTGVPDLARSIDRAMARKLGGVTPLPSLHLGAEPPEMGVVGGHPGIYRTTITWDSAATPIIPEISPRQAFDLLFDTSGMERRKSLLDATLDQSQSLRRELGTRDQRKLDEFMESIRGIEHRIERTLNDERPAGAWRPALAEPNITRPDAGLPDLRTHHELMMDILVLALQMDKTRIATLVMESDTSGLKFDFLDGVSGASMHGGLSHHQQKKDVIPQYQRVNQYHVEQVARMCKKMRAIDEGNGSLLDNTMLTFGSNLMDGDRHDCTQLPVVLIGGRNCDVKPGRVLSYEKIENRRLMNLHVATAQRMGLDITGFGNSTFPLFL